MSLIHIAGRIHRRAKKNRDGTYTYYYRRHVGYIEGGTRKSRKHVPTRLHVN